jgi:beta-1,4-N-acetylglucosaminyltransferase
MMDFIFHLSIERGMYLKICFAASSGGHLEQLMMLYPMMKNHKSFILTEKTKYKFSANDIKAYDVTQINRREFLFVIKLLILMIESLIIFLKEKPEVVISTGALATIPICLLSKLFRKKLIFIESFSKITSPTITGKLMSKIADLVIIQWADLKRFYPNAIYGGGIY